MPTACATTPETQETARKAGAGVGARTFAGHEYDVSDSLSYMGARYYDPALGRFLSEDPAFLNLSFKLEDPQSLNSYAYARNNPLVYIDPDGKTFWAVVSGHQSIGSYGNELYANGGVAQAIMDHPYAPAVIGAAPLAAYGIVSSGVLATPVGAAIARQGGLGAIGGAIGQYISDIGNNLADGKAGLGALAPTSSPGSYVSSAGKGFGIGVAAEFGGAPLAGLGAAGISVGSDLVNGKSVSWGNAALSGVLSFGATGLSEAASGIPGRLANPGSLNYFFGAHAQQEMLKEAVGVGVEGVRNITQPTLESPLKKKK